jgi:hypothetical protein
MSNENDFDVRKQIFEEIKRFNKNELEELYRILKRESEEISENRNGMFFDLNSLKISTISKIHSWIRFCKVNRQTLETREKEMGDLTHANPGINEWTGDA